MAHIGFVAAVFLAAGLVKGLLGMGLPTIGMGLLVLIMPPVQAAALLALPSLLTNVWQTFAGPGLAVIVRRTWTMMLGLCAGTWAGAGLMTGEHAQAGTVALGLALAAYAAISFSGARFLVPAGAEFWLSPAVGVATGVLTAATGVFAIPAVPYLQALGFEKEELVQALGLSFTVSTLSLAVNIARAGAFTAAVGLASALALGCALAGVLVGQTIRQRMHPERFRTWFLLGLLGLGLYVAVRSLL